MWRPKAGKVEPGICSLAQFSKTSYIFCAWQEKAPLNQTGSSRMQYISCFLYSFRWNIEVSYYEQKSFWPLCRYMLCSRKGVEMLVNLINLSYCAMKFFPYMEEEDSYYDVRGAYKAILWYIWIWKICRIYYAGLWLVRKRKNQCWLWHQNQKGNGECICDIIANNKWKWRKCIYIIGAHN